MANDEKKKGLNGLVAEAASRVKDIMARPTSQMSPNIVLPHKRQDFALNFALTGELPQQTNVTGGVDNATDGTAPQLDSYDKMLEYMQATQVADADAAGRARRRELMAAIGDGISAVSSLYQTTKGATVTYTPGADMSKVMRDRYDRMIAQRKADSDKYLNYLKVQAAKEQAEATKAYRLQQLADTKEYRDALVDQGRERTEAYILNKKLSAAGEVAFNAAYNQEIENGSSEDDAIAAANIAKDQAIADAFNAQVAKDEQAAADKHAESQKKQDNIQARTDKTKATPAKSTSKSKQGKGGSTKTSPTSGGGNNSSKKVKKKSPTAK